MSDNQKIPHRAMQFLRWFCPAELREGIEGDLAEQFSKDSQINSRYAKRRLWWNVLRLIHPSILLRNRFSFAIINTIMVNNYIKVALRNIQKRKLYAFINSIGLSIGIAFCILIYLFVLDEVSFDQFHANKEEIYRIDVHEYNYWTENPEEDTYKHFGYCQLGLRDIIGNEIPMVKRSTRFSADWHGAASRGDLVFSEKLSFVDADFFQMFSFKLTEGSLGKLFATDEEVVITQSVATKFFGEESALGQVLDIDTHGAGSQPYIVSGVVEDPPANSSIDFRILMPIKKRPNYEVQVTRLGNFNTPIFVQLSPGASVTSFHDQLSKMTKTHMGEMLDRWRKEANVADSIEVLHYGTTPLTKLHLNKQIDWHKVSDPQYSYILTGIALLILLIACINYISLALTSSAARRTEVGVRKVMGAFQKQLIAQFGVEAFVLVLISLVVAFVFVYLSIPYFNNFTGKIISISPDNIKTILTAGFVLVAIVGLLAGSYPSLLLSGFKPVAVLKGQQGARVKVGFARPLVVLQFTLSAFLIVSSIIMFRQMEFLTTKNLGFEDEQILVIPTQAGWSEASEKVVRQFRERLAQEPGVVSVSGTSTSFNRGWSQNGYKINGVHRSAYVFAVDPYYIPMLNIDLVAGRNFDIDIPSDTNAIIVNEALVRDMGWTNPLDEYLNYAEDSIGMGAKVIGVVKDYHYRSLETQIEPMFLSMDQENVGYLANLLVEIEPGQVSATIESISKAWKELYPDKPFDYSFLDQDVANQYESYNKWMSIMGLSTFFAILISCLGLFGLAGVNAMNRTKEIGIRKVMGAEIFNIFIMMNKQFVWLALIAFVIAIPFSGYVMNQWLSKFEYRVDMDAYVFLGALVLGVFIALATVTYHSLKAAFINPAETLKHE